MKKNKITFEKFGYVHGHKMDAFRSKVYQEECYQDWQNTNTISTKFIEIYRYYHTKNK